jgi:heme-degrading monooxygenase HmoA
MIFRKWSGRIRAEDRDEYLAYVLETGASDYQNANGNLGFQLATRQLGDGTLEVSTMSWWESLDCVRAFAGEDPKHARYYPQDDKFLVEKPKYVEHYCIEAGKVGFEVKPL